MKPKIVTLRVKPAKPVQPARPSNTKKLTSNSKPLSDKQRKFLAATKG